MNLRFQLKCVIICIGVAIVSRKCFLILRFSNKQELIAITQYKYLFCYLFYYANTYSFHISGTKQTLCRIKLEKYTKYFLATTWVMGLLLFSVNLNAVTIHLAGNSVYILHFSENFFYATEYSNLVML